MLVVLRRSWLPGYNSTSPGVTGGEALLYLGCPQCLGECEFGEREFVPLLVAVPRLSVGYRSGRGPTWSEVMCGWL